MRRYHLSALLIIAAVVLLLGFFAVHGDEKPAISGKGKSLVYPKSEWAKLFPAEIEGVDLARKTGEVVAATHKKVYFFRDSASPEWTARGWEHVQDLHISNDGKAIFFQTDDKPKKRTESMDLTMRLYNNKGERMWEKPNPRNYVKALLSPAGNYILTGEMMHLGVRAYDRNLNRLWKKQIQFWYLEFDPLEKFVFDGQGGRLYTIKGKKVWEFDKATQILSVSDNAEFVLARHYASAKSRNRMFLNARKALKKQELAGTGGCVSPDGTYTAYVNEEENLVVYRTRELLENGPDSLPPLFETGIQKPWSINLARDNRSLYIMGKKSRLSSVMMLVDLDNMEKAWEKTVKSDIRTALPTENNRQVAVKTRDNTLTMYSCY
ncbi:MAG: hypothetical protein R6V10_06010 [bacterium]